MSLTSDQYHVAITSILKSNGSGLLSPLHPNSTFLSGGFKKLIVRGRSKKMSAKFVKFDKKLVNLCEVQLVYIFEPTDPSQKAAVRILCDNLREMSEYFDSLDTAQARFSALEAQLTA